MITINNVVASDALVGVELMSKSYSEEASFVTTFEDWYRMTFEGCLMLWLHVKTNYFSLRGHLSEIILPEIISKLFQRLTFRGLFSNVSLK